MLLTEIAKPLPLSELVNELTVDKSLVAELRKAAFRGAATTLGQESSKGLRSEGLLQRCAWRLSVAAYGRGQVWLFQATGGIRHCSGVLDNDTTNAG